MAKKQGKLIVKLLHWYTPFEALRMATYDNAQLIKLCGPRDPYPGELGVVKEGALADLILVDGNPLENLDLVADPDKNFVVIMMLFQPVFPFFLEPRASGGKANLFIRPAIPLLVDQSVPELDGDSVDFQGHTALGDIGYGVTEKNGFLWAFGMVGTPPTATDSAVAGKQLRLGPEMLLAKFEKWGVYGISPSHQWKVAGWSDGDDDPLVGFPRGALLFLTVEAP